MWTWEKIEEFYIDFANHPRKEWRPWGRNMLALFPQVYTSRVIQGVQPVLSLATLGLTSSIDWVIYIRPTPLNYFELNLANTYHRERLYLGGADIKNIVPLLEDAIIEYL